MVREPGLSHSFRFRSRRSFGLCGIIPAALLALSGSTAHAQKTPAETIASIKAADAFEVKLFASEPMISNPIAIDIDTYGRIWVTEGTKYRKNVADPPDDKLKVLEDTNGDGVADKVTVFASDLNAAMGVCVAGSKIYVPESPNLYVYEDRDNDLRPDGPRKVLLTGLGAKNHDHGTHSQVFGPDHKLYMTVGDTGYDVTGPDGRHIKFRWGAMVRCEADGSQLEDFAVNFRNPVELAVDSFGNVWCSDNDNDGLKSVRICWILEGGDYGWFGRPEDIKNPDGTFDPIHHWRADKPGYVPHVLITGFGSPCGMMFYEHDAFGTKYRNKLIHCDSGPREIRSYDPHRLNGVGYAASLENIVTSSDNYFRPIDPCVAPDGSIYVTDWYDGGVGGHNYNDPTRGRIYRITPKGKKPTRAEKPGPYANDDDALAALASPNQATQFLARERLLASGEKAIPALTRLLTFGKDEVATPRALWLLDRIGGQGREPVRQSLKASDPRYRALAVRILRRHGDTYFSDILALAGDADGEVLKEVLFAVGKSNSPTATSALLKAYDRYDGSDRYLLETLGVASKGREAEVFAAVVDKPGAVVTPRLVNIVRILRPQDATKYLSEKLTTSNLTSDAAASLLAALSSVTSADAGRTVLAFLSGKSGADAKKLGLEALRRNLNDSWSELRKDPALKSVLEQALADKALTADTLALIGDGGLRDLGAGAVDSVLSAAGASRADRLAAIGVAAKLGLDSSAPRLATLLSSDDAAIREAALRSLVVLRDSKSLGALLSDPNRPASLKEQAADLLVASSDGAVFLFRMVDTKKLPQPLADRVIAAAVEHPDVNVQLLFEKYIPPGQRPKTLGESFKIEDILALKGDASRGETVFVRSGAASCNKCHRVKGKGTDVGPDLSQIGRKYERRALLETIMNPSAGIAPEYVPYVVETTAGKVYAGFLHDQNDERIVLRTIEGLTVSIPRKEVVELSKQQKSLMPELVLRSVTAQDAADLLAYLAGLQETAVHASTFKVLGPFSNARPDLRAFDYGPEKTAGTFDVAAQYGGGLNEAKVNWTETTARPGPTSGLPEVDLGRLGTELKTRADNVIYYFAVTLDSAAAQPATLLIGSDDGVQVWVNGKKVHDHKVTRALVPASDKVPVELKQGKNLILLKLDQGGGAGGLSLSAEARANLMFGVP